MTASERPPGADAIAARAADAEAAGAWLETAIALTAAPGEFATAADGYGGHELALLDFDPASGDWLRRLGAVVATPAAADLRVALAIAGSAAQSRIHPFPADVDFFERLHFLTPTLREAHRRLGEAVRACALEVAARPGFFGQDVRFGLWPPTAAAPGRASVAWSMPAVRQGVVHPPAASGGQALTWTAAAATPGLVKLSWFLGDRALGGPLWVSKVIDATWQAADGTVVSLDGQLDAEFQQVYLEASGAALAAELIDRLAADDRARYLRAMEREVVNHRRSHPPNYAKAAKRLYNVCRLTGRFAEALFLQDAFDEPVCRLYQARVRVEAAARQFATDPAPGRDDQVWRDVVAMLDAGVPAATARNAAAAACQAAMAATTTEQIRQAVARLDLALAELVNGELGGRYFAHPPIAALLRELDDRYPDG